MIVLENVQTHTHARARTHTQAHIEIMLRWVFQVYKMYCTEMLSVSVQML